MSRSYICAIASRFDLNCIVLLDNATAPHGPAIKVLEVVCLINALPFCFPHSPPSQPTTLVAPYTSTIAMDTFLSFENFFASDDATPIFQSTHTSSDSNPPVDEERYGSGTQSAFCTIS